MPALLLAADALPRAQSAGGTFAYSRDDGVIVEYSQVFPQIAGADRGPRMRIHGDGRVEVHYPAYMKRAGDYQLTLTAEELDALVASLIEQGLMEFDAQAELSRAHDGADPEGVISTVADAATTIIDLRLQRHAPGNTDAPATRTVRKRIVWRSPDETAETASDGAAVQKLGAAERELLEVMERADLEKVR
jgi:hypothetical protein